MPEAPFQAELDRIRETYAEFKARDLSRTLWAPFQTDEAAMRAEQLRVFSELMRRAGHLDLDGMRVLDFGCGTGRHLRQFLDMGGAADDLFGVDLDADAIRVARERSPHLRFAVGTGATLDFPDAHFDLVTQHVVFSSVAQRELRETLAAEIVRVLRPGGFVYWWDMVHMARAAGGSECPLAPRPLFPGLRGEEILTGRHPRPSDGLRPLRGLRRWLAPFLDRLGFPRTHRGILFGPKA